MLWSLAPIKNEIFRPTKSFISLKKARKRAILIYGTRLGPVLPQNLEGEKSFPKRRSYMYYVKQMKPESSKDSLHNRYALG